MKFIVSEYAIINQKAEKDLPSNVGDLVVVTRLANSPNYQYDVELPSGDYVPVRECELNKLTGEQKELIKYLFKGNEVSYIPTGEYVKVVKTDFIHNQVEIEYKDKSSQVVGFEVVREKGNVEEETEQPQIENLGKFTEIAFGIGEFTDMKNKQYGSSVDATYEMIKVLMERYKNNDNTYTIPESLLQHILLQVRMMDKINRIFNNPSGEGDSESPYNDLAGYSLIGIDMVNR